MYCQTVPASSGQCSFRRALTFGLYYFHIAACAVIQQNTNITGLQRGEECISSVDWLGQRIVEEDCSGAVQRFYNIETLKHGKYNYEFLGKGASPEYKFPVMQTPRRYSHGEPNYVLNDLLAQLTEIKVNARSCLQCWTSFLTETCQLFRNTLRMRLTLRVLTRLRV